MNGSKRFPAHTSSLSGALASAAREELDAAENLRARSRLVRQALILGVSLVLLATLSFLIASHIGFEHMACKIAEDALGSALHHAHGLARQIQDTITERDRDRRDGLSENAERIRRQLHALVKDDPTVVYAMLLSREDEVLVHTEQKLEKSKVVQEGEASALSKSAREFPRGRLGYKEFIYEVRTPLVINGNGGHMLALGLSKTQIDLHIDEVRSGVRVRMLLAAGVGAAVLVVPGVALWLVLRRHRQLARMAQDLALLAQMGEMANGLAHEIRNPLNAIRFNLKIMEEDADHFPEEVREGYVQLIRRAAGEIDHLDDLLAEYLSYVRPGRREAEPQDLNAIVESVLGFVEYECRRHNIQIERNLSPGLPKIVVDERQLKQAVLNVVLNAQQALRPAGGHIRAISYARDDSVALEIADDGPGVPKEERLRIFQPFYSNREGGTGLGLAIARRVVKDHGGTIQCEGRDGRGASFIMTFPRHQRSAAGKE